MAKPRQLVRDPDAKLGGVASGLAHHYGIDVSLVRVAIVLVALSTGIGILAYILAWIIIPRAEHWPPAETGAGGSLTTRELAIGLLALGAMVALFSNGGRFAEIVVPVLLIGGGAWLLSQPEASTRSIFGARQATSPYPDGHVQPSPFSSPDQPQPADTITPPPVTGLAPGTGTTTVFPHTVRPGAGQVPPRRRRRLRSILIGLFLAFVGLIVTAIVAVIALVLFSDFEFNGGFNAVYQPTTIDDIPTDVSHGQGSVTIDLTSIDPDEFSSDVVPLEANLDFGELRIIVPEGLAVQVDADVSVGDLTVFGNNEGGIDSDITVNNDDPGLRIDASVGFGDLTIERGPGPVAPVEPVEPAEPIEPVEPVEPTG